jgi:uncharacterized protein (DUF1330 family)
MNESMSTDREAAIDMLLSRVAIQDLLARYSQALDRCDIDRLKAIFWPEAKHSMFDGNIMDFTDFSMATLRTMDSTMHSLANFVIEFDDSDHAHSETYGIAYHEIPGALGGTYIIAGGRYLDRFERRSGEWRILERFYVIDWNQIQRSTQDWEGAMVTEIKKRGGRFPDDPSFGFFRPVAKAAVLAD